MKVTAVFVAALATLGAASPSQGLHSRNLLLHWRRQGLAGLRCHPHLGLRWCLPPYTSCIFYKPSKSPYCVPPKFKFPQN
ncbi:hypothetical protein NW754_009294 [Fusarium falciforme]|nr:hypothetical protein NW754_009294 [Fusarium falciforme]